MAKLGDAYQSFLAYMQVSLCQANNKLNLYADMDSRQVQLYLSDVVDQRQLADQRKRFEVQALLIESLMVK